MTAHFVMWAEQRSIEKSHCRYFAVEGYRRCASWAVYDMMKLVVLVRVFISFNRFKRLILKAIEMEKKWVCKTQRSDVKFRFFQYKVVFYLHLFLRLALKQYYCAYSVTKSVKYYWVASRSNVKHNNSTMNKGKSLLFQVLQSSHTKPINIRWWESEQKAYNRLL